MMYWLHMYNIVCQQFSFASMESNMYIPDLRHVIANFLNYTNSVRNCGLIKLVGVLLILWMYNILMTKFFF